jgi:hypothetical protein
LPPPPRVIPPSSTVSAAPSNYPGSAAQAGPKKETARISILPQPAAAPAAAVRMAKTQPLSTAPPAVRKPAAVITPAPVSSSAPAVRAVAPASSSGLDMLNDVPMPVAWVIFGISTITLLIQIWNYFA